MSPRNIFTRNSTQASQTILSKSIASRFKFLAVKMPNSNSYSMQMIQMTSGLLIECPFTQKLIISKFIMRAHNNSKDNTLLDSNLIKLPQNPSSF